MATDPIPPQNPSDGQPLPATESKSHAAVEAVKHVAGVHQDPAFVAQTTVDPAATQQAVQEHANGVGSGPDVQHVGHGLDVLCGPLLNYKHMSGEHTDSPRWHGSILIVTQPGQVPGQLRLSQSGSHSSGEQSFSGEKLFEDPRKAFWRFKIDVPFQEEESTWEYLIPDMKAVKGESDLSQAIQFVLPSKHESMRIMFHSCNGFSAGTDEEAWSGAALWNDVLRVHKEHPFHVMIGGGDQIYNDGVRVTGPLKKWTAISNPKKRRDFPFNEALRAECDEYYFNNYTRWYGAEPFAHANARIAQLNIWDDHDIIDGFGSYTDHFMKCAVFRGIGGVAHKYYLLFQHHIPPPPSTFTTDAPQTMSTDGNTTARDAIQLKDSFVMHEKVEDPSFIIGSKPGPYVEERSRSIYCQLGKNMAFAGIDARTERTRHQINYPETYDAFFSRLSRELSQSNGSIKHLILLLGIPIAYPRLQWLENILQSPLIGPIRFLNKRFGFAGGFFNHFDGNVDLLDDLDDHYTAHQHKKERKDLMHRLQHLAKEQNIRVTILGGDVHLAALGRFYSNPKLSIAPEQDFRYMANIVSSAITNKPPPQAVANLLARRNKIHHLDHDTDETLLELFDKNPGAGQPGVKPKTAENNHATMPSRNYAIITESNTASNNHTHTNGSTYLNSTTNGAATNGVHDEIPHDTTTNGVNGVNGVNGTHSANATNGTANGTFTPPKNPRTPLHRGEQNAGTTHPAASGIGRTGLAGAYSLDVTIRVEISPSDREGKTQGYGFCIPALEKSAVVA